jgi:uncharacterized YigZ family protein
LDSFFTISAINKSELNEKNSKFLGFLFPCSSMDDFEQHLNDIKHKYPDATHYCYAYRVGLQQLTEFANDDGEPGGTAGLPILNKLKSYDIQNACLVVIRYYGGTKLGKQGLIKAYGTCAELCLEKSGIVKLVPARIIKIQYPYNESNRIDKLVNKYNCRIEETEYLAEVSYKVNCPAEHASEMFSELSNYEHLGIKSNMEEIHFTPSF